MTCQDRDTSISPCKHYVRGGFCRLPYQFRCLEYLAKHEMSLSYSNMQSFIQCRRAFYYGSIAGIQLKPEYQNIRMLMGQIWSEVCDEVHKQNEGGNIKDGVMALFAKYTDQLVAASEEPEDIPLELAKMQTLAEWYMGSAWAEAKGSVQHGFKWQEPDYPEIYGLLDLLMPWSIYDMKYSKHPQLYGSKFIIEDQSAIYFLGTPGVERITFRAFRVPGLRTRKDESIEEYKDRLLKDIERQPGHYLEEYSYWRSEFDLERVKNRAKRVALELGTTMNAFTADRDLEVFWQDKHACYGSLQQDSPAPCQYLPLCETYTTKLLGSAIYETQYVKRQL